MSFLTAAGVIFIVLGIAYLTGGVMSTLYSGSHFNKQDFKLQLKYQSLSLLFFILGIFLMMIAADGFSVETIVLFFILLAIMAGMVLLDAYTRFKVQTHSYVNKPSFWSLFKKDQEK
jgi:uncharacterized membrane protein HdeD (DUF308 family)